MKTNKSLIKPGTAIRQNHEVGNKARGLQWLMKQKLRVPEFYVITYADLQQISDIQKYIDAWKHQNQIADSALWSVRSSANVEDGQNSSFAGLFRTRTHVSTANLADAIAHVKTGYERILDVNYQEVKQLRYGIIVQKMLKPDFSGVAFSQNPIDSTDKRIFVNLIPGLGENLVSDKYQACNLILDKGKIVVNTEQGEFTGQKFDGQLVEFTISKDKILDVMQNIALPLEEQVRELSRKKKQALDIEFCIVDNELYWLQVRPMTALLAKIPDAVWDNSNIGENYPDLSLPLTISFVQHTYDIGYCNMAAFLGMSDKLLKKNDFLFKNIVGGIDGRMYYRITSWQQLLYQLPLGRKTSHMLPGIMGMEHADFQKPEQRASFLAYLRMAFNLLQAFMRFGYYKNRYEKANYEVLEQFRPEYLAGRTQDELISDFNTLRDKVIQKWIAPLLNGLFAMLSFAALRKVLRKSRLTSDYPNFVNDVLFAQGDVVSVRIVRDFQKILDKIAVNQTLVDYFQHNNDLDIQQKLKEYPGINQLINNYIENYGERCENGELKMEIRNYKDNPLSFIALIKRNLVNHRAKKNTQRAFNYRDVLKENYGSLSIKAWFLKQLISLTINRIRDRENYRFLRTRTFALARAIFREMGKYLQSKGLINNEQDFLYLEFDELMKPDRSSEYKVLINSRKQLYEQYKKQTKAPRFFQFGNRFQAAESFANTGLSGGFKGVGCCSGIVKARVMHINSADVDPEQIAGKILVASYFEPAWINMFSMAAGIISEKGNLLSHTAILCREMGVPSIVGAKKIMEYLPDGTTVQMDGATGFINIIEHEK